MLGAKVQMKKEAEAKRIEQAKKSTEIAKSKQVILRLLIWFENSYVNKNFILQSLLEKYIEEQKKIIILMEERKETMTAAEKTSMMDMLKLLSSKIETAKEEVQQVC